MLARRAGPGSLLEFGVAVALILLNGVFSLSELAIVQARKVRLRAMADQGRRGASAALALAEDPGRFLSTVQIGITLIGILAGAFSGAALAQRLTDFLVELGWSAGVAEALGYLGVIGAITYVSVVVGELVPKNLALRNAESIACAVAPLMTGVSRAAGPVVWILDASTRLIFRLLGRTTEPESAVTDEEIRTVMAEAETAGVIETHERRMVSSVLRLGDRAVRAVMTPRTDVEWIDVGLGEAELRARLSGTRHSRLPVADGDPDNMIGAVQVREALVAILGEGEFRLRSLVRTIPVVPDTLDALETLKTLREAEVPMVLVHDEYGHFEGLVTPADILEAIAGAFRSDDDDPEPGAVKREDGSWLLAGWMPVEEAAELIGLVLPERRSYETVAGLVIGELRHLPATGEAVNAHGWRLEVVDLDGRRVDKVLATRLATSA